MKVVSGRVKTADAPVLVEAPQPIAHKQAA